MSGQIPAPGARPVTFRPLPTLSGHRLARFAAIVILYFMQGVPVGMTIIAVPAWLAANGASPVEVAAFVGTALLPWSLKLFNGLLMDRFAYKPMGRRRAWIMCAQALMAILLLVLALVQPGSTEIAVLTAFFFALNLCATFNDVAVDGMTVDLVPAEERATVNSLMFAAQAIGISTTSFIAGQLLADGAIGLTAMILAGFVALASTFVALFRERPGERLLPWTSGCASPECIARQQGAWRPILTGVIKATLRPLTLLFLTAYALAMATAAYQDAVAPVLAVQQLGWGSDYYSSFASSTALGAAVACVLIATPLVRMMGLRRAIIAVIGVHIGAAILGATSYASWEGGTIFAALFAVQYVAHMLTLVMFSTWAMHLCSPALAASQFALFMAVPNLARSIYSGNSGFVVEEWGYGPMFYLVALSTALALVFALLAKIGNLRALD